MTRAQDEARARLEAARAQQHEREQYMAAARGEELERRRRGTAELRVRFKTSVRNLSRHEAFITLDAIRADLTTVTNLTIKHVHALAREAGLTVGWDGVIERNESFDTFVRTKKVPGESR